MSFRLCHRCQNHYLSVESRCPHCAPHARSARAPKTRAGIALLMGIGLLACEEKETDTAEDTAIEIEPEAAALYGVEVVDEDGDGFEYGIDCDDQNPDIHPEAEEIPGDGIDSNCNNDDDT